MEYMINCNINSNCFSEHKNKKQNTNYVNDGYNLKTYHGKHLSDMNPIKLNRNYNRYKTNELIGEGSYTGILYINTVPKYSSLSLFILFCSERRLLLFLYSYNKRFIKSYKNSCYRLVYSSSVSFIALKSKIYDETIAFSLINRYRIDSTICLDVYTICMNMLVCMHELTFRI